MQIKEEHMECYQEYYAITNTTRRLHLTSSEALMPAKR